MRNTLKILLLAASLAAASASPASAQTQDQTQGTNGPQNQNNTPSTTPNPVAQSYSVSLATGEAISLSQGAGAPDEPHSQGGLAPTTRTQFLYGATASSVYMNNYTTNSITDVVTGVLSPYVGVYRPTRTGGFTLQYLATFTPQDPFSGDPQAFHALSLNAIGAFNHRWYWGLSSTAEYGSETARFEGPLTYMVIGLVPVVDPVASGAFLKGRNGAFTQNAVRLGWLRSPRDKFELIAHHTYTDLQASTLASNSFADRANAVGARLEYSREVTSRFKFLVFAQEDHIMESSCNTYGGGAGISANLSHNWSLELNGGPQRTSANCGSQQNANFFGALTKALRGRAKLYVVGQRYFNTAFQTQSTWQDAVAAGLEQEKGRWSLQADVGYFKGQPLLVTGQPFQGYYTAPLVRYKMTESSALSAGYRLFHATGGNTVPGTLHFVTVSLEWHPQPVTFK